MSTRSSKFRPLLAMAALLTVASPARGAELPFRGTLSIEVAALPAVQVAGAGVATLESPPGTAQLTRAALPPGIFAQAGFSVAVSSSA